MSRGGRGWGVWVDTGHTWAIPLPWPLNPGLAHVPPCQPVTLSRQCQLCPPRVTLVRSRLYWLCQLPALSQLPNPSSNLNVDNQLATFVGLMMQKHSILEYVDVSRHGRAGCCSFWRGFRLLRNVKMKCDNMAQEVPFFKGCYWGLKTEKLSFTFLWLIFTYFWLLLVILYCCVTSVCLQMMLLAICLTIIPKYALLNIPKYAPTPH